MISNSAPQQEHFSYWFLVTRSIARTSAQQGASMPCLCDMLHLNYSDWLSALIGLQVLEAPPASSVVVLVVDATPTRRVGASS
jgi:hypothetical protein